MAREELGVSVVGTKAIPLADLGSPSASEGARGSNVTEPKTVPSFCILALPLELPLSGTQGPFIMHLGPVCPIYPGWACSCRLVHVPARRNPKTVFPFPGRTQAGAFPLGDVQESSPSCPVPYCPGPFPFQFPMWTMERLD